MQSRFASLRWTLGALIGGACLALATPGVALAHSGFGDGAGFIQGALHPWAGLDHLFAMIAVGLWAGQRGGQAVWVVPATFLAVMTMGGAIGIAGISLPGVEAAIVASVLVLGLAVAGAIRMPLAASCVLVGAFALFHGHAHGAEMPATASGLSFAGGFLAATACLQALGVGLAMASQRRGSTAAVRMAGAGIAACGLGFCLLLL